ncbi:MAG: serine/threonine protein kinase [Planctomycetia bacterium]|nr:serine/threonine protein kinase [Planctomycetia bacterium]
MDDDPRVAPQGTGGGSDVSEERQRKIKEVFFEACNRDEAERSRFVREACGDDQALRREIELLLAHHSEATIIPARRRSVVDRIFNDSKPSRSHSSLGTVSRAFYRWALRLGLSGQLALGAAVAIVVLVGMTFWLRGHIADVIERSSVAELDTLLNAADTSVTNWIDSRRHQAQAWVAEPDVQAQLKPLLAEDRVVAPATNPATADPSPLNTDADERIVQTLRKRAGSDAEFVLWDRQARSLFTTAPVTATKPIPPKIFAESFPRVLAGESLLLMPHQCEQLAGKDWFSLGKPLIGVLVPIRKTDEGEVTGILFVGLPSLVDTLNTMLAKFRPQATGEAYAFDRNGRMLSESRFRDQLIGLGLLKAEDATVLNFSLRDPCGDLTRGHKSVDPYFAHYRPQAIMRAVNGLDGVVSESYRDYRGVTVLGASRWRAADDFGLCVEIERSEALSALHYTGIMVVIAMVLLVGTFGAIVWSSWSNARLRHRLAAQPLIGSYLLDIQIGEGGMGRVYRAQHALLKRPTAVKIIRPDLVNDQTLAWFEREVKLAARLSHPNTIEIYDYGRTENGQFYCAMEYLRGLTLSQVLLVDGYLPLPRALHILYQACASLAEAHDLGLIHRDVKLHNLMLCLIGGEADFVKVLDFGLAKQSDPESASDTTRSSRSLVGTPLYMAPERLKAPYSTDARGDVYSIGVVAFKLLTGRDLFTGDSDLELFNQTLHQPAPLTSSVARQAIPPELDRIVAQCLAKDPDERPRTARAIAEALESLVMLHPWKQTAAAAWWRINRDRIRDLSPHWDDKVLTALAPIPVKSVPGLP